MSIWKNTQNKHVILDLQSQSKVPALKELAEYVSGKVENQGVQDLLDALLAREKLSSTAIGAGVAIPHARIKGLKERHVVVAKSAKGLSFDAIDDKPVHLIFCVLSPQKFNEKHLKLLARIAKFLHDTAFKEQMLKAVSEQEVLDALELKDKSY